jgi:hypothetical protein
LRGLSQWGLVLLLTGTTRDGNWWLMQSPLFEVAFVSGFFDGMDLGYDFSFWGIQKNDPALAKVAGSYSEYASKFAAGLTAGQLSDGLDSFYSDYRNRRIPIVGAVWLVLNGIPGTTESTLQTMIENWRKNAALTRPQ